MGRGKKKRGKKNTSQKPPSAITQSDPSIEYPPPAPTPQPSDDSSIIPPSAMTTQPLDASNEISPSATTSQPSDTSSENAPSAPSTTAQPPTTEVVAEAHAASGAAAGLDVDDVCREINDSNLDVEDQGRLLALLHYKETQESVMQLWQRSNPHNRPAAIKAFLSLSSPASSSGALPHSDRQEERLNRLEREIHDMAVFHSVVATMLAYDEDAASVVTVPHFKGQLITQYSGVRYDARGNQLIYCMVTHEYLPSKAVIGGHLWKRLWHRLNLLLMGFEDIHDSRNGLLLFKILEWAFDTSSLCFVPDEQDDLRVYILNPALLEKNLVDEWVARDPMIDPYILAEVRAKIGHLSFKDVEGRWLKSDGTWSEPRPFRRVLWFQARRACIHAKEKGWDQLRSLPQIPSVESVDFANERKERLDRYFASMEGQGSA